MITAEKPILILSLVWRNINLVISICCVSVLIMESTLVKHYCDCNICYTYKFGGYSMKPLLLSILFCYIVSIALLCFYNISLCLWYSISLRYFIDKSSEHTLSAISESSRNQHFRCITLLQIYWTESHQLSLLHLFKSNCTLSATAQNTEK